MSSFARTRLGKTCTRFSVLAFVVLARFSFVGSLVFCCPHSDTTSTSKYSVFSFLPKFLFEQFRKYSNIFFFIIVMLQVTFCSCPESFCCCCCCPKCSCFDFFCIANTWCESNRSLYHSSPASLYSGRVGCQGAHWRLCNKREIAHFKLYLCCLIVLLSKRFMNKMKWRNDATRIERWTTKKSMVGSDFISRKVIQRFNHAIMFLLFLLFSFVVVDSISL